MNRPKVSLKLATSLDGKIALANGRSQWITSEASRARGRVLRATHDAIAVGSNTAILDNPKLTCRIENAKDPVRVIYDSCLRLPVDSHLAQTAKDVPVIIVCSSLETPLAKPLKDKGISLEVVGYDHGLNIGESLHLLQSKGIETLLVEGGGTLAASFLRGGFIDEIHWFRAPKILGGDGRNGIGDLGIDNLKDTLKFNRASLETMGVDTYEVFERAD